MSTRAHVTEYRSHKYSGPRPNRKRVLGQMKRFHGTELHRSDVWRTVKVKKDKIVKGAPKLLKTYKRLGPSRFALKLASDLMTDMQQGNAADCSLVTKSYIKTEPEENHSSASVCENMQETLIKLEMDDKETIIKEESDIEPDVMRRPVLPAPGLQLTDVGANCRPSVQQEPQCYEEARNSSAQCNKLKKHVTHHIGNEQYLNHVQNNCQTSDVPAPHENFIDLGRHKCNKLNSSNYLNKHHDVQTGEKQFSCEECNAQFGCSRSLIDHNSMHTGETPFTCEICDAKFRLSDSLMIHKRIHTGEISINGGI